MESGLIRYKSKKSVSGLAVKFDVAIVEPPVRLRANAYFFVFNQYLQEKIILYSFCFFLIFSAIESFFLDMFRNWNRLVSESFSTIKFLNL